MAQRSLDIMIDTTLRLPTLGLAAAALMAVLAAVAPARSQQTVDLQLVLAIDASGSVDAAEFDLQMRGLAEAFRHPDVIAAIKRRRGIAVAVVQWGGPGHQIVTAPWTAVGDATTSRELAARIESAGRQVFGSMTAIDKVLRFAVRLMADSPFQAGRRVIDVSGDGKTNYGSPPDAGRDHALAAGVTVNGLAILNETADLAQYYRDHVIGGAGSFLMTVQDYQDFATAIRRKLLREILDAPVAARPVGRAATGQSRAEQAHNRWTPISGSPEQLAVSPPLVPTSCR